MWRKTASGLLLAGVLLSQMLTADVVVGASASTTKQQGPALNLPKADGFTWGQLAANVVGWAIGGAAGGAVACAVIGSPVGAGAAALAGGLSGAIAGGVANAVAQLWPTSYGPATRNGLPSSALD